MANKHGLELHDENFFILNQENLNKYQFLLDDFTNSGINTTTLNDYLSGGYFHAIMENPNKLWQLFYPEFKEQKKSEYYTIRHNTNAIPNFEGGKYERPAGESSRLFRPLHLPPESIEDKHQYLIFTEGEKKAIKAVQEGFPCVALAGIWCWKQKPDKDDIGADILGSYMIDADIIPDIKNTDFKNKTIYLCFDNDMWQKVQVKNALYNFAAYLISEKKAKVKVIYLPENKDEKLGIDDYLIKYGAEEFKKLISEAEKLTLKKVQDKLVNKTTPPPFPMKIFPTERLKTCIEDLQKRYDAPLEYIASLMVAFSSVLMLGKYEILVKRSSNWVEQPIIWMSIIGEPSQKKSPCMKIYQHILQEYQIELDTQYKKENTAYKNSYNRYKTQLKNEERKNIFSRNELSEPEKPKKLILSSQNTTIEALCRTLESNNTHGRLASIVVDELSEFLKSLGQYKSGSSSDNDFLLQAWNYQSYYSIQRVNSENISIELGFSIIGTIQNKPLLDLMFPEGINSTNGRPQRWLYVTTAYDKAGFLEEDDDEKESPDVSVIKEIFNKLFYVENKKQYFFNSAARSYFVEQHNKIIKLSKQCKSALESTYLDKISSYIARFALIIHCWYNPENLEITEKDVYRATCLANYFYETYKCIIKDLSHLDVLVDQAWEYIQINKLKEITPTALSKANKKKFKDAKLILEKLANRGFGRPMKTKNGGRKFIVY